MQTSQECKEYHARLEAYRGLLGKRYEQLIHEGYFRPLNEEPAPFSLKGRPLSYHELSKMVAKTEQFVANHHIPPDELVFLALDLSGAIVHLG